MPLCARKRNVHFKLSPDLSLIGISFPVLQCQVKRKSNMTVIIRIQFNYNTSTLKARR